MGPIYPKKSYEMDFTWREEAWKMKGHKTGMKEKRYVWINITRIANDRSRWKDLVSTSWAEMYEGDYSNYIRRSVAT